MPDLADVVIVGGGILGVSLAYELSRRTYRVALLESRQLTSGATGNGFAWINATSKTDDETYHRLNALAMTHYDTLAGNVGAEQIGLHSGGALFWAHGADGAAREQLHWRAARLQHWNYPVSLLTQAEIQALEPEAHFRYPEDEGAEGLFAPADRWVETFRLARFLMERTRERSGDIREYCPATGFSHTTGRAISTVETAQGRIATRLLVLAAGAHTPMLTAQASGNPLLADYVPVKRVPGLLVETPPASAPGFAQRVLYPPDAGGLHLRPTPGGGLLIGADDMDAAIANAPPGEIPQGAVASLLERAAAVFPKLALPELLRTVTARVCVRPVPADERPIVGPLPDVKGVYVVVTHSGVTLGPLLASLLAEELISGYVPPLLAPYRPDRFLPPGSLPKGKRSV